MAEPTVVSNHSQLIAGAQIVHSVLIAAAIIVAARAVKLRKSAKLQERPGFCVFSIPARQS